MRNAIFLMISNYRNVIKLNLRKLAKSLNLIIKLHFSVYIIHITVLHSERASYINDNIDFRGSLSIFPRSMKIHNKIHRVRALICVIRHTHIHTCGTASHKYWKFSKNNFLGIYM